MRNIELLISRVAVLIGVSNGVSNVNLAAQTHAGCFTFHVFGSTVCVINLAVRKPALECDLATQVRVGVGPHSAFSIASKWICADLEWNVAVARVSNCAAHVRPC